MIWLLAGMLALAACGKSAPAEVPEATPPTAPNVMSAAQASDEAAVRASGEAAGEPGERATEEPTSEAAPRPTPVLTPTPVPIPTPSPTPVPTPEPTATPVPLIPGTYTGSDGSVLKISADGTCTYESLVSGTVNGKAMSGRLTFHGTVSEGVFTFTKVTYFGLDLTEIALSSGYTADYWEMAAGIIYADAIS